MPYTNLYIENETAFLELNRPNKRNALNKDMIAELTAHANNLQNKPTLKLLIVSGKGKGFCAGADISWLQQLYSADKQEIAHEFGQLAIMLRAFHQLPFITIAKAHGPVFGGGNGFLAVSDFAFAEKDTTFSFSEINLGIIPATISPFIAEKLGMHHTKQLFFSGERFGTDKALQVKLIDGLLDEKSFTEFTGKLLSRTRPSLIAMKQLLRQISRGEISTNNSATAEESIAQLIKLPETQGLFNY